MIKELFVIMAVLMLLAVLAGCAEEGPCGNAKCESGEENPDSANYCPVDCLEEENNGAGL
ncbi:MAG: hypothetical protein ABID38_03450 [Candidatus Diapherotrites archaeon]